MPVIDQSPPSAADAQTISQSDIESLLALVDDTDSASAAPTRPGEERDGSPQHCDFPSTSSLSERESRKLRIRHEEFIASLASRLSLHLRLECGLKILKLETAPFRQFIAALSNPTHLALFKLEPLRGLCLLDIPLRLGLCIVDRELGGAGRGPDEIRELSKIEAGLLNRVAEIMLHEWSGAWSDTMELRPALARFETNARFLQTHPPQTAMLLLSLEFKIGECVDKVRFAFPCHTIEPLLAKLQADPDKTEPAGKSAPALPPKWNAALNDLGVNVSAELDDLTLTARQLAELKPGDFIPLASGATSRVQVCLEATPKFLGNLGHCGRQLAVQITQVAKG